MRPSPGSPSTRSAVSPFSASCQGWGMISPFRRRHLGLIPPQEHELVREALLRAGGIAEEYLDMEGLIRIARAAPPWSGSGSRAPPRRRRTHGGPVRIGVIRDTAFQFYYHENIEALAGQRRARSWRSAPWGRQTSPTSMRCTSAEVSPRRRPTASLKTRLPPVPA